MSENNPEPVHQDPAEPNQIDTEVETADQPDPDAEITHGGEAILSTGDEPLVHKEG